MKTNNRLGTAARAAVTALIAVFTAAVVLGCMTTGSAAPYYFAGSDEGGATVYIERTLSLAAVEDIELAASGAANPLFLPAGEPFMVTVSIAGSAHTVRFPVPPLEEGVEYQLGLRRTRHETAILVLSAVDDGRVIHEEIASPPQ